MANVFIHEVPETDKIDPNDMILLDTSSNESRAITFAALSAFIINDLEN